MPPFLAFTMGDGGRRSTTLVWRWGVAMIAVLVVVAAARVWGLAGAGWGGGEGSSGAVVLELRANRVAVGALVGAALAVSGVMLQALMRNPLAAPDLLGLSSGAGLGVAGAVYGAWAGGVGGSGGVAFGAAGAAVVGALGSLAVVYLLGQRRGLLEPVTLILVGVVVGLLCAAGTEVIRNLMPDGGVEITRLLAGSIRDVRVTDATPMACAVVVAIGVGVGVWLGSAMDAASLSEDEARSVGVAMGRLRAMLFIASGVLAASAVVLAGSVGFVGLIAPHVVRRLVGPSHRVLVLLSAVAGAALVIGADLAVAALREAMPEFGRLPISVLTSLVGGPVIIAILRGRGKGGRRDGW
ncbi:MAG: FecCD family ABC transporter permease [Phycisphaerales bacterium]